MSYQSLPSVQDTTRRGSWNGRERCNTWDLNNTTWRIPLAHILVTHNHLNRQRSAARQRLACPARLTWKDSSGAVRFAAAVTRDVSEAGVFVECDAGAAIPMYRLVHLQIEKSCPSADALPRRLREARVLSAVWRVAPCRRSTGTPSGYALRFLVEGQSTAADLGTAGVDAVATAC